MEKKKSTSANLQNKKALFFEIGLIAALILSIAAFAWGVEEKEIDTGVYSISQYEIPTEIVPVTREDLPKKQIVVAPKVDLTKINVMPDNMQAKIEVDPTTFDPGTEIYIPRPERVEAPVGNEPFVIVEQMPRFMDGNQETFRQWVMRNIAYPSIALENRIMGRVVVEFVVEKDGTLSEIKILQTPDRSLSEATVATLSKSPKWEPGRQRNMPARVKFTIPVDFRLE